MAKKGFKQTMVITGGSRGIGRFLLDSFLPSHNISACARNTVELDGRGLITRRCDLGEPDQVDQFVQKTITKFGRIDVLIHNAGIFPYDKLVDVKEQDIDELYRVTVKGYLFLCQNIIPIMIKQGGGYIINISSIRGLTVTPDKGVYGAMKRAAISLTESIKVENYAYGIRATSLHLGTVDTESSRKRYGGEFNHLNLVRESDILSAIKFLLSLSGKATVDGLLINGEL